MFYAALFGIVTTGVTIDVGPLNLFLERAFGLVLMIAMAVGLLNDRAIYSGKGLLLIWLGWNATLLLAMTFSENPVAHLSNLVIAILPTAYFWFVLRSRFGPTTIDQAARITLWLCAAPGAGMLVLHFIAGVELPLFFDNLGRLKILTLEPNLLGSTIGFLFLLSLPSARFNPSTAVLYVLTLATFVATQSKMPFLAMAVSLVIYGFFRAVATGRGLGQSLVLPIWLAGAALVGALAFAPGLQAYYESALQREDAISARAYLIRLALRRINDSPIIGNGPGDFGLQNPNLLKAIGGEDSENNLWIPQMFVNIVHDSGILGTLIYIILLLGILSSGYRIVRHGSSAHVGYLAAFIFVIICSQASTVHLNAIFGIAAGLVVSVRTLPRREIVAR